MRIGQSPQDRQMMAEARRLAFVEGDVSGALELFQKVLKRWPREPELLSLIGMCLIQLGNLQEARKYLRKSIDRRPTADAHRYLSRSYVLEGRTEEALDVVDRGLRIAPDDPSLRAAKANALFVKAEYDAAYEALADLLERDEPPMPVLLSFSRLAHRVDMVPRAIDLLRNAIGDDDGNNRNLVSAYYALGDLLNRAGAYDDAFAAYERANRLRNLAFDASHFLNAVDHIVENWTREAVAALPRPTTTSDMPYFIVGMPRSGTSLAEQIIASHSEVVAAGELPDMTQIARSIGCLVGSPPMFVHLDRLSRTAISRGARTYLNAVRKIARGVPHVTDKMPTNFVYLGLIAAMLPEAKVVHCVRDPRDSCLSCYFQSFSDGLPFTCKLSDLGAFYRGYTRLMDHWKKVLEIPIFDLVYADLVDDLTGVSRRMIDFLGLEWEDACETFWLNPALATTASLDQIRRPIYTSSVGRWKNYEGHLDPLLRGLEGDLVSA